MALLLLIGLAVAVIFVFGALTSNSPTIRRLAYGAAQRRIKRPARRFKCPSNCSK